MVFVAVYVHDPGQGTRSPGLICARSSQATFAASFTRSRRGSPAASRHRLEDTAYVLFNSSGPKFRK